MKYIIHTIRDFNKYKIVLLLFSKSKKANEMNDLKCNLREKYGTDAMIFGIIFLSNICTMYIFCQSIQSIDDT